MSEDPRTNRSSNRPHPLRAASTAGSRVLGDALVVALWVVFLTLAYLSLGWPRWSFYALLVLGVVAYVQVTAPWTRKTG